MSMDSPQYIDLSASALCLTVLTADVDASQFAVLMQDRASGFGLEVEARVIGASHFISFKYADLQIHEIVSCAEVKASSARIYYGSLEDVSDSLDLSLFSKVSYAFTPRIIKAGSGDGEPLRIELMAQSAGQYENQLGLVYEFSGFKGLAQPKTIIWLRLDESEAKVSTIHSYPNERNIVVTQSRISIER
jgi:hypothetical protein